ncbi:MAG: hypothetical protein SNJ56_01235, partial [Termitinemataceae bacterium]
MNARLRTVWLGILVLTCSKAIFAQTAADKLQNYQRLFVRSSLSAKIDVVNNAVQDLAMTGTLGTFFDYTLSFVLQYSDVMKDDPDMIALASRIAQNIASQGELQNRDNLWRLFMTYRDSATRVAVLDALAIIGKGDSRVIENLNQFLSNQNNVYRSGLIPDYAVLAACITALGLLGDGTSFPVLFSTMIAGYPSEYSKLAAQALGSIKGDYKKYLIDVIRKNPPLEKLA